MTDNTGITVATIWGSAPSSDDELGTEDYPFPNGVKPDRGDVNGQAVINKKSG